MLSHVGQRKKTFRDVVGCPLSSGHLFCHDHDFMGSAGCNAQFAVVTISQWLINGNLHGIVIIRTGNHCSLKTIWKNRYTALFKKRPMISYASRPQIIVSRGSCPPTSWCDTLPRFEIDHDKTFIHTDASEPGPRPSDRESKRPATGNRKPERSIHKMILAKPSVVCFTRLR